MSTTAIPYNHFSLAARERDVWAGTRAFAARHRAAIRRGVAALALLAAAWLGGMGVIAAAGASAVPRGAEVMLVLGTKVYPDGTPSERLRLRLEKAVALFNAGFAETVIVSGGTGAEGVNEAAAMRAYLVKRGVPAERIVADGGGVDTFASARFTAAYLREHGQRRVLVVSQFYHVPRAAHALRRFGVPEVSMAAADGFGARSDLRGLAREVPGCVVYALRPYGAPGS